MSRAEAEHSNPNLAEDLQNFAKIRSKRKRHCAVCALPPNIVEAVKANAHVGQQAIADWLRERNYADISRWTVQRHLHECQNP